MRKIILAATLFALTSGVAAQIPPNVVIGPGQTVTIGPGEEVHRTGPILVSGGRLLVTGGKLFLNARERDPRQARRFGPHAGRAHRCAAAWPDRRNMERLGGPKR